MSASGEFLPQTFSEISQESVTILGVDYITPPTPDERITVWGPQAVTDSTAFESDIIDNPTVEGDILDPLEFLTDASEAKLGPETESLVAASVGAGSFAMATEVENVNDFVEEPLIEHVNGRIKKVAKQVAVLGVAAATLAAWGFELGPWNESLRANIGFDTFADTFSAAKTGLSVFLATLPIEFVPAALVSLGLSRKNMPGRGIIEWMHRKLGAGEEDEDKKRTKMDVVKDGSLALGVGAAAVVAKRFATEKDMNLKEGLKTSAVASPTVAVFSGGVGWATAYGILHAEGSRFEGAAKFLENNGTDAKFWLTIFGGLQVIDFASKAVKNKKERKQQNEETVVQLN